MGGLISSHKEQQSFHFDILIIIKFSSTPNQILELEITLFMIILRDNSQTNPTFEIVCVVKVEAPQYSHIPYSL